MLRADGFEGPRWDRYADELARYGCSRMRGLLTSGAIVLECRKKGRPIGGLPTTWTQDDRLEATLRTYFMGSCVLALPNVLRAWRRDDNQWDKGAMSERRYSSIETSAGIEPVQVVDAIAALESLIKDQSDRNRAIFRLSFRGHSAAEIAEILEMTPGAVRAVLDRGRRKIRQDGWDDVC